MIVLYLKAAIRSMSLLSQSSTPMSSALEQVIAIFNCGLGVSYNTRLVGGFGEPLYLPAVTGKPAEIRFREDFVASALHEVAHWCIAGPGRREQLDFGYFYEPERREPDQQMRFERFEVKPQALEWIFSSAAGLPFRLSRDNFYLDSDVTAQTNDGFDFAAQVADAARGYCLSMPERAGEFAATLAHHFGSSNYLNPEVYQRHRLC